ncbi:thiolase family protein [Acinetobacter larvae]|uniref:Beta-ketoadipyl-CoA thiolase n=1 Tax=Acinetobacter larvae TaxID=1789224 RepID=A0A1B2LXZ6_9GAMM|nr:thiolase family protein [Acinetobacter larvae]AOA57817.1 acetyl-CoA acetyltransferase [Acinetobacter larvae]
MNPVYIVQGARTAMGAFQGSLATVTAPALAAATINATLSASGLKPEQVQEVILGCVLPAGLKQAPARQAMRLAALPDYITATTINKVCGSGMKAIMFAADSILLGHADVVIAGGMESMSNAPYLLPKARAGYRMGHGEVKDHMFLDGLEDAGTGKAMGVFAQQMADEKGYSRQQMDDFAIRSLTRAQQAIAAGYFQDEIVPVEVQTRQGTVLVSEDEQPGKANLEKIPQLKAVFRQDGTVTAANSSSISDGAASVVLASQAVVDAEQLTALGKIVAYASHAQHPSEFTIAPIGAIEKVLQKAGWSVADVELWEINEAFAMVTMAAIDALGLDAERVNIHGGACALGHPLGASGARIVVSLMHALKRTGQRKGIASLCIGGGEATAIAIEIC